MGALKLTACMKVVAKMGDMDQESLLERLDRYTADGVPKDRAQVMAAADTLAELIDERREFMAMLREQHPQLFVVTNAIPEDQDVDPDSPDIKRSAGRSEDEIASARADGWTIADNDLPSREAAERIVKLRTKGNSIVKPIAAWQDAEVRVVESDNPGLWSIEVRNPGIQRSPARDITDTTEFKRWFGDSKVVDADGKPLVVYHGTGKDFGGVFNTQGGTGKTFDTGAFFTASTDVADSYTNGSAPNVAPVYLSLTNPLVVEVDGANWDRIPQKAKVLLPATGRDKEKRSNVRNLFKGEWDYPDDTAATDDIARWARKQGYDGVIFRGVVDRGPSGAFDAESARKPADMFVAFRPEQIKSAIGNNGQFDPENPDIRMSANRSVTETPEFKEWSGGAPVVPLGAKHEYWSGQPVVVEALHGTTNTDLAEFKRERANIESDWGAGFYASNTPDDVATNYASNDGADLTNRIEMMAERLASNEFDDDMEAARDEAKKRLTQESPNTLKLYVRMSNPAVQGGKGETFFDYTEDYDEETDSYDEPTGMLVDFVESLRNVADDFDDVDVDGAMTKVWERATGDGIGLTDLVSILKSTDSMAHASDRNGDNATNEVIRRALEVMGFDGVIDTTVSTKFKSMKGMNKDTVHFIAFKPTQLKSATGNRGTFDPNDADITRSPGRTATGAAWDSPSAEKFDDLVYKLQDKLVDTKRVVEAIKTASGSIADDLNVYLQEELYHGRAAKRTEGFVNMELNPLIEQMARDGLKLEDVEEFMHARHAPEANAVIAQRNPGVQDLQDGGSGMKTADALQYMATLPADLKQKLEAATAKVDAIIAKTRELYVDYELESRDTVDAWGRVFQHYIPLMREDKDGNGSPGLGQGFSVKGKETKGRTGSTRKVVDIMANIAMQRERAIVRGEKNRVSQALVGLATANPNEGFWQVDEVPTERVFNEKTGLVEDRVDPLYKSRPNAIIAKIKGPDGKVKEHAVLFNEEDERAMRMAAALKNLDASQLEGLMGISATISRYFASINTSLNPIFGVVNAIRDIQGVALNLSSTPINGEQTKVLRNTASAIAGIYGDARKARKGVVGNSKWANLWEEFQSVGGQTGYRDLFRTSEDRAEAIKKTLNPDGWADSKLGKIFTAGGVLKVPLGQARRAAAWLFDLIEDYNLAMENGVRLSVYKAGLDRGLSKEQAASIAKNASTNFNRKGQIGQQAGALYAFFNASVQGTARIGQTLFDMEPGKPKTLRLSSFGKKVVYGGMMLGVMQALALAAAGYNEDDPPDFVRERSLVIPVAGGKYITIPMPLGFNVIPNIGRMAAEFAMSGFKNPEERAVKLISLFAEALNPIGNAGLSMQTLAPTALDPFVALTENKDYTGKPIARESSNEAIPGHALGRDTASSLSKFLSESINALSGGNKYVAGVFSPTPDQLEYLLGQLTGGVGRELSKIEQSTLATARGEDLPTYKIPLVGRFVGDTRSQASEGTAFYANTERLNRLETEIKGLQKDGKNAEAAELRRSSSEAYLITMANQAERQIQKLRAEKRELVKADAPREQVAAIEERITAVMARLNRAVEGLREKQEN